MASETLPAAQPQVAAAQVWDDRPFVSVIIPVFNDEARLELCLQALDHQTYPHQRYEVIVVDNGSQHDISGLVRRFARAVPAVERKPGSYAARNTALTLTKGEVLAFTDSDCIPSNDWIEKGVARLLGTPNCGLVAGKIDLFFKNPARPSALELYERVTAFPQQKFAEKYHFGATANVFTFNHVIKRVGAFNDTLKSGGDREWGQRVHEAGYAVVYADDACVLHPARNSWDQFYNKSVRVISGLYDLKASNRKLLQVLKAIIKDMLPPTKDIAEIWHDQRLNGVGQRLRVVGVLLGLRYAQAWARLQIGLGRMRNVR